MLNRIREQIEARLVAFVRETYGVSLEGLVVETPPKIELGELAFPFPFELAKKLHRPPRSIAEEVAGNIGSLPWTRKLEAAGAGYLNVHLDRALVFRTLYDSILDGRYGVEAEETPGKIIVEHTNINPNKAAHIGHLRNAALGDTFVRILRFLGHPVETQNYIDNTGVQVADVVVGFQHVEKKSLDEVARIDGRFDYYCWDLYARVSSFYPQNPQRLDLRQRALKEIEEGDNATAALAEHISTRIVQAHLNTMNRIGVRYDLLPR
ncbi:MAG: arginine--tRNA ligase, partial [Acidobacteria bacterium]|nr:arginine--tRNA ligase [Acidobacteriota bacterium]